MNYKHLSKTDYFSGPWTTLCKHLSHSPPFRELPASAEAVPECSTGDPEMCWKIGLVNQHFAIQVSPLQSASLLSGHASAQTTCVRCALKQGEHTAVAFTRLR